jgi:hypothetical protein
MHVLNQRETKIPRPESESSRLRRRRHTGKELLDQLILFLFGIATYVGQNLYDTVYNNKEKKHRGYEL